MYSDSKKVDKFNFYNYATTLHTWLEIPFSMKSRYNNYTINDKRYGREKLPGFREFLMNQKFDESQMFLDKSFKQWQQLSFQARHRRWQHTKFNKYYI